MINHRVRVSATRSCRRLIVVHADIVPHRRSRDPPSDRHRLRRLKRAGPQFGPQTRAHSCQRHPRCLHGKSPRAGSMASGRPHPPSFGSPAGGTGLAHRPPTLSESPVSDHTHRAADPARGDLCVDDAERSQTRVTRRGIPSALGTSYRAEPKGSDARRVEVGRLSSDVRPGRATCGGEARNRGCARRWILRL